MKERHQEGGALFMYSLTALHRSQIIFWCSVAFLLGVAKLWWTAPVVAVLTLSFYRRQRLTVLWLCVVAVFAGGWWRYNHYLPDTTALPYGQVIAFEGQVMMPPRVATKQRLTVRVTGWPGSVLVPLGWYPPYQYGDVIAVQCELQQPTATPEFAYDKYLARYGVFAECRNPAVKLIASKHGSPVFAAIYDFRTWLQQHIKRLYPEPTASVLTGIIIGIQDDISADTNTLFRQTGTIHILVVSGMHVMLIVTLFNQLAQRWLGARRRFVILIFLLMAFSILTGLSASVIRAALMGLVVPLAQFLGRPRQAHITLALIAAAMTALNPYVLLYDVGFQLSFLATLGLIYIQPVTARSLRVLPKWFSIQETISTSVAAMIPTTPLILSQFGTFSTVSLLANLVVLPVSNVLLFGGVATLALSLVNLPLGRFVAFPLWQLQQVTFRYLHWLLTFPHAYVQNLVVAPYWIAASYTLLFSFMLWRAQRSTQPSVLQ